MNKEYKHQSIERAKAEEPCKLSKNELLAGIAILVALAVSDCVNKDVESNIENPDGVVDWQQYYQDNHKEFLSQFE